MTKFTEVFKNIKIEKRIQVLFEQVEVERLVSNSEQSYLRIYLISDHLIQREDIKKMEKAVEASLKENLGIPVYFDLRFRLSDQYTPENLYNEYKDSILDEIKERSNMDYLFLRDAEIQFDSDRMIILLEDTFLARQKEDELWQILEKIICRKCNVKAEILFDYKEAGRNKYQKENEYKVDRIVEQLKERLYGKKQENTDEQYADFGQEKKKNVKDKEKNAEKKDGSIKKGSDPDCLYGRDFNGEFTPISEIIQDEMNVILRGKIIKTEFIERKNGKFIYVFTITDFTDSINAKIFCTAEQTDELGKALPNGAFILMKGNVRYDEYDHSIAMLNIFGIKRIPDFTSVRMDTYFKKRVELHCHTKMSDSDGVSYAKDIIDRARKWGMSSIAITDHGCVQAFPEAYHATEKAEDFKVLYGVEGYLVDDSKETVVNCGTQTLNDSFVVFDIETTGFSPVKERIIEIGAVKVEHGEITDTFSVFVNPGKPIPYEIQKLTSITDDMVRNAPPIEEILPDFLAFSEGSVLVAHNAGFDMSFIIENCRRQGLGTDFTYLDTVAVSRSLLKDVSKHTLDHLCKYFKIDLKNHHRAVDDAGATAKIFEKFIPLLEKENIHTLKELNDYTSTSVELIRKLPYYHIILLAKNEVGRVNLYRMVSQSHITYFNHQPRIPRSLIEKYREGIIIGSACEAGELCRALLDGKSEDAIAEIVNFYDYLEIQPIGNNAFMIESDRHRNIKSEEDLRNLNRRIVKLGEEFNKPVCATCDVHFLDPEDEIYRRIIMAGKGFDDADRQAPLYLHTTEEMLKEFEYLGSEKAEEVVITNTNRIADMCEKVCPIHPDKCPPVIPNSDETLRTICYTRAHEIYGEILPPVVAERLERELKSIIGNGFAVMYIIAQKLVWKSNEDGYLVGSRGSVGSSFVATMAGITEVNPLAPHYYCPNCRYSDFDSDIVKSYAGRAGCDLPDTNCPKCGTLLKKDGFDIPFETFLGFYGDKEPDIDLNFSGEYQAKAHKYTEVIFGAGQTFRAGTIGTLAEKTAFGYVKKYFEERGIPKRECEMDRISKGCVDVRRTTGQHPGGIIVLPLGYDINQFTPIQHPANDMETDIITTHFDYHSIDHNLLKLDILGHDDPSMIRKLQDLTGVDPLSIPLDDPEVMTLFRETTALGITPDAIGGCPLGCLGIPEFGTDFVIQMLVDTKPTCFSDLVRISGLSHGTDVWVGNAKTLIDNNIATISTAICTRDDIMTYLISKGLDSGMAFNIMENVRKGKVAKKKCDKWEGWKQEMEAHDVPSWYIESCEKILYMFPKAHAAAYVMMAWRIAYFKIKYPHEYYAAYFSIRATAFSYELMCQGKEHLEMLIKDYQSRNKEKKLSNKEEDTLKDMRIVQEMYARGLEFEPIDIFRADTKNFLITEDRKIMPSLISIEGLAEKAGEGIVEAAKNGPFLSKDDFRERSKVSKTLADTIYDLGLLGEIPESNQIRLFDLISEKKTV